jgi:hypothetical protein
VAAEHGSLVRDVAVGQCCLEADRVVITFVFNSHNNMKHCFFLRFQRWELDLRFPLSGISSRSSDVSADVAPAIFRVNVFMGGIAEALRPSIGSVTVPFASDIFPQCSYTEDSDSSVCRRVGRLNASWFIRAGVVPKFMPCAL